MAEQQTRSDGIPRRLAGLLASVALALVVQADALPAAAQPPPGGGPGGGAELPGGQGKRSEDDQEKANSLYLVRRHDLPIEAEEIAQGEQSDEQC